MRNISCTARSVSNCETSREDGGFTETFIGQSYKGIICRANSIPIIDIFKYYGLHIDEYNRKHICPFKSHKNGRENTPSFIYYHETNTFFCWGCKVTGKCCDFVSEMDNIKKLDAANKILSLFDNDDLVYNLDDFDKQDFSERLEIMLDFSNSVREFRESHYSENSFIFIEKICKTYDDLIKRHDDFSNDALKASVRNFKKIISIYREE
jgi:hypothetical protein